MTMLDYNTIVGLIDSEKMKLHSSQNYRTYKRGAVCVMVQDYFDIG